MRFLALVFNPSARRDPFAHRLPEPQRLEGMPGSGATPGAKSLLDTADVIRADLGARTPAQRTVGVPPGRPNRGR
jgi:hypothetical protein